MSDEIPIEFLSSFGSYRPGDRTGRTDAEIKQLKQRGAKLKRLTTEETTTSKSDPDTRQKLSDMATDQRIEEALDADDYNEMRKVLADVSDKKATGDHDQIRQKLEAELES